MYVLYTDDSIMTGPSLSDMEEAAEKMESMDLVATDEGDVGDYLGVRIDRLDAALQHSCFRRSLAQFSDVLP